MKILAKKTTGLKGKRKNSFMTSSAKKKHYIRCRFWPKCTREGCYYSHPPTEMVIYY
jgi:hypothetical protein